MSAAFTLTSRDNDASLILRELGRDYFIAEARSLNLFAQIRAGTYMSWGFGDFFAEMAAEWRGWKGTKQWQSFEGELRLSAEADRTGHVGITAKLQEGAPAIWAISFGLLIEAGQLDSLASEARAFEGSVLGAA